MLGNTLFITTVIMLALTFFLLGECQFLVPYKQLLITKYAGPILTFAAALFVNLFALIHFIGRKLFLKDTGRKLAHLEKELRSGSLSEELRRRLEE